METFKGGQATSPRSAHEVDAWDASKSSGVWDYYEFLVFVTLPSGDLTPASLMLFFATSTFFGRPGEFVTNIPLTEACREVLETTWLDVDELLRAAWESRLGTLKECYGSADLGEQVWTIAGQRFTVTDADQ